MSLLSIVRRSLLFHWRIHVAVALGVAAAAAVLTGALLVGDSVRGSLRFLALDRLGQIDELLIVDRFFREELAEELVSQPEFTTDHSLAVPAILFPSGTVEAASQDQRRRAGNVLVIGASDKFWQLGDQRWASVKPPGPGEIVLNAPLAEELAVKTGGQVTLRLDKGNQIPADSPLGQKSELIQSLPSLTVTAIVPSESLGRFSLSPMQTSPRNAYVSLATVQEGLDAAGKANAIFVAGNHGKTRASKEKTELTNLLQPRLADLGLTLKHVRRTFTKDGSDETVLDYFSLSSDRMMLDAATEREALAAFGDLDPQPALTYLANEIKKVELSGGGDTKGIPYSTITAIDPADGGPLIDASGKPLPPLATDEIVLTSWAAEDQGAQVGDRIRVTYFEPETTHGEERETSAEFRVAAIVPLTTPSKGYTRRDPAVFTERPTTANDPDLTPEVKGITDQASIDDWDPPFPMDNSRLRDQDDTYWEHYRTTPKAYVSLAAGQKLWGSRFGKVTSIRIPAAPELSVESLERQLLAQLQNDGERLGMEFQPLKAQAIAASAGTTPFDVLFLLLSMFIIAAALLLVWLLFRLGVEQRAGEIGTLLAMGWTRQQVGRLLLAEGLSVSSAGALLGVVGGVGYAWLMLAGLRSWWIGAIASPFLTLYVTPLSLVLGFALALIISGLTIWLGVRGLRRVPARQLMAGIAAPAGPTHQTYSLRWRWLWLLVLVAAIGLSIFATRLGGEMQAVAFLASGALVLVAILLVAARMLRENEAAGIIGGALAALVVRNAGRNLSRSITTIALMAAAAFLIVAVSSFRLSPTERGTGGFDLIAESSQSVIADLNSSTGRQDLFAADAATLEGTTILAFRVKPGDDASCRNLYQPSQPRVLGVTPAFVAHFDDPRATPFGWAASAAIAPQQRANPWLLLSGATPADEPVPVVLDKTTAMYSLKLYRGIGEEFTFTYDERTPVKFRVVGLLDNSVLQGSLLVSEANFVRLFPQSSGYRSFLIDAPADHEAKVAALLEDRLGDEGFDAADTRAKLADLLAVQNTYISTFQSLGAIGLLLGTFGVAAAQLRSVFERRQELALLRATGFRAARLGRMVLLENLLLLIGGLAAGSIAALVTVLPHMLVSGARVPLVDLAAMLGIVLVVGVITGLLAVRATLDAPLIAALRGE